MNKTLNRVLSMVLSLLMLASMLTVFAVAETVPASFGTAYECAVSVDGVAQISKEALLVDTTITEADGTTITRKWDGTDYSFVVGTNAFATLTGAYAYANEHGITSPDIIITGWTEGEDLVIEAESNVYAPNWNTVPMNEMGDMSKVGVNSNAEDWTENTTYTENQIKIGSITVKGSPANWIGVHGFTITKYLKLATERKAGSPYIEYLIKNCKMDGVETTGNILKSNANTDVNSSDVLTFQNFWLKSIGGTVISTSSTSRFFGDNTRHYPHMVFDGLYIDFSAEDLGFLKRNDHLKSYFANSSITFKNSNMRRSANAASPYWNFCQNPNLNAVSRELNFDNNTLFNTNQSGGFIYIAESGFSGVNITNNLVVATTEWSTEPVPLIMNRSSVLQEGFVTENTYKIVGNKLLGVKNDLDFAAGIPVPMYIEDNFTVSTVKATFDEYKTEPGEVLTTPEGYSNTCSGSYIYDFDMKHSSHIKVTEVEFGNDTEIEVGADTIVIKCLGEYSEVTPVFKTNPDCPATGKVLYELSTTPDFAETIDKIDVKEIAKEKVATLYLRAYYEDTTYKTDYQLKVIATSPVLFNDSFMENGLEYAGKKFVFNDTAVFVKDSKLEADGNYYGYGFLGDIYYRFKVDNEIVFDTLSMLKLQMTGVEEPNILLPSGEYGKYTFEYPAKYYGANAGINPADKSASTDDSGDGWTLDSRWGKYADTAFDTIYFADGLEGKIYLEGMTVRGQINDTLRTMGKDGIAYGNLDITFNNTVIQHVRKNRVVDERDAEIVKTGVGESTADRVINLINKRSVNSKNEQIEVINNARMLVKYKDFDKTYAYTFTVKNLYVKDMRNAVRLFGDFVPANLVIDGLYIDIASLGETAQNTIGYFKTGAAVKNGSFTLINSNIRNGNVNDFSPVSILGPKGSDEKKRLEAGDVYKVVINDNIFCNVIPAAATSKAYIILDSPMLSSFEFKNNKAFQTGAFIKKKGIINSTRDKYEETDLLIIGNCVVDNNWFVGFDATDATFDIGLGDNNPLMTNTFVSPNDDAHLTTGITGIYTTSFGDKPYYIDYKKTITNEPITPTINSVNPLMVISKIEGTAVTANIYEGATLADITILFKVEDENAPEGYSYITRDGYWATSRTATASKAIDPSNAKIGGSGTNFNIRINATKVYYYIIPAFELDGHIVSNIIYTVKVTGTPLCTEHQFATVGTYNNDATCQSDGTQTVKCTTKGCDATDIIPKDNTMVDCVAEFYESNNDATCVNGTETGYCKWCGTQITREIPNSKDVTAHNWGEWVYNNDATCCKDGTETRKCSNGCGETQTQTSAEHLKATDITPVYDNDCDEICNLCGTIRQDCHIFDNDNDPTCVCGYERFDPECICGNSVHWRLDGTVLTILGNGEMYDYSIENPSPWGKDITSVIIQDGVTSVGNYAFYGCSSLTSVTIPDSVTSIGRYAFGSCTSLTSVTIPDSVSSIGEYAFYNCSSLTSVDIPDRVTSIGDFTFRGCTSLTSVTIPDGVTEIGEYAFYYCSSLTSVDIPDSVTSIDYNTFYNCTSLTSVTIPESVTEIGGWAFSRCTSLTSVTIPRSVTSIDYNAFYGCSSLENVSYGGPREQHGNIKINSGNEPLLNALWICHEHIYDNECDAICNSCGDIRLPEHLYDNACDTDCNTCGATREITHKYDHDCDTNCNVCGVTRQTTHKYDNACDRTCNECRATRQTTHAFGEYVSNNDATYEADGTKTRTCSICGFKDTVVDEGTKKPSGECGDNLNWYLDGTVLTISGTGAMYDYYNNNSPWYSYIDSISKVVIDDGVTSIGNWAFNGCGNLENVEIANSVVSIGDFAFRYCSSLKSISLPEQLSEISDYLFYGCTSLETVYVPATVTRIGAYAFDSCGALTTVNFGCTKQEYENIVINQYNDPLHNATKIYHEHTYENACDTTCNCGFVREITHAFGEYVSNNDATYEADGTKTRTCSICGFKDTVVDVGTKKPSGKCGENLNWYLDGTVLTISGTGSMTNYTSSSVSPWGKDITKVVIKDGVTGVGSRAFYYCESLTSVTIPDSVTSIGYSAFYECSSLMSVTIPDSVTSIGNYAFYGCTSLTSVTIGNSVTSIGDSAFSGCTSLISIDLPDGLTSIGSSAFGYCGSLTKVDIPDSVTSIGYDAFRYCESLTSVTIPDSVTSIGNNAFSYCSSLKSVYITDLAAWCNIDFGNSPSNPLYNDADLYVNNALVTDLVIPQGVTEIKDYAFNNCKSLTSVTIPDSVTSIGQDAFYGCTSLTSVTIGNSVTSISDNAFEYCTSLTSVTIPDSVTEIGEYAFRYCESLTSIDIPNSVTSIGKYAFCGCNNLRKVALSSNIQFIEPNTFASSGVKVVYIPKDVILIKNGAFNNTNINYVYYGGSEEDKQNLTILPNNGSVEGATWVYNAEGLPDCQYDNSCDPDCNICGETREITHEFGDYVSNNDATADADGTKTRTCSVCGHSETVVDEGTRLPGFAVNETTGEIYKTFEEALANVKSGQTLKLTANVSTGFVNILSGVTLDLNGYTLKADAFVGFKGSNIIDTSSVVDRVVNSKYNINGATKTGGIYVPKDNVIISNITTRDEVNKKNTAYVPVYDSNSGCYRFIQTEMRDNQFKVTGGNFSFMPIIGANANERHGIQKDLLATDNILQSGLKLKVRVTWVTDGYDASQDFSMKDEMTKNFIAGFGYINGDSFVNNYKSKNGASFSGAALKQADKIYISAVVASETGAEVESIITEVDTSTLK